MIGINALARKVFKDKAGRTVIIQRPNIPLWGWVLTKILATFTDNPNIKPALGALGSLLLIIWALLETISGVTIFRKLLGIIILAIITVGHII